MDLQKLMDQLGVPIFLVVMAVILVGAGLVGAAIFGTIGGFVGAIAAGLVLYEVHRMGTRRPS
jgi:hypothetical protein